MISLPPVLKNNKYKNLLLFIITFLVSLIGFISWTHGLEGWHVFIPMFVALMLHTFVLWDQTKYLYSMLRLMRTVEPWMFKASTVFALFLIGINTYYLYLTFFPIVWGKLIWIAVFTGIIFACYSVLFTMWAYQNPRKAVSVGFVFL